MTAMHQTGLKQSVIRGSAALLRAYYRHVPLAIGKRPVWDNIVTRLLTHGHDVDLEAKTLFGARMHVRFPDTIQSYVYFFGLWEPSKLMADVGNNESHRPKTQEITDRFGTNFTRTLRSAARRDQARQRKLGDDVHSAG